MIWQDYFDCLGEPDLIPGILNGGRRKQKSQNFLISIDDPFHPVVQTTHSESPPVLMSLCLTQEEILLILLPKVIPNLPTFLHLPC